ncbi:MAG: HlyD family efflux transporter periplasmic adaptor subunit [Gemmatimonadaceae bacterium]|nr:HlyD family efflux transporter periplasmic adaptor subunit [Gemmatimonadaceae bacterium]
MNITRRWRWIVGTALIGGGAWIALSRTKATDVDMGTVTVGALRVSVDEDGTTRVRGHADVSAPVGGRWVPSALRAGDAVRAGDALGSLFPAPLDASAQDQARARLGAAEAAQREAETRVTAARAALDEASRGLARAQHMVEAGGMSPQDLERARDAVTGRQSEFDGARLRARAATYEMESARAVVAPFGGTRNAMRIVAPVGGTVLRVFEEHERVVAPGALLTEVGDPRDLEVVIPLLTSDAGRVRVGAAVSLTFGERDDTLRGRVSRVEPSAFTKVSALGVEEQRVNIIATAPATEAHVGDQYRVHARVTVWESPRVVRIPAGALVRDGEQWFTYVVTGGRARRRAVKVGERGDNVVEVREGLADGDRVVVYPGDLIADGLRVRPR